MKIAIVGTGIAGMVAADRLHQQHDITVYEAADYIGGHTNTVEVETGGRRWAIDTGFIVFNERTYPGFIALMDRLGVASQPTEMSFSVRCQRSGLEYNGHNLDTLFAQRSNLLRPSFYRMIRDILRFNEQALAYVENGSEDATLADFLADGRYGRRFIDHYLIPMGAAIWSTDPARMFGFPAQAFLRFFRNHGLLSIRDRPQWRSIVGGSGAYIEPLTAGWRHRVRLATPVTGIERSTDGVRVLTRHHGVERFDHVFVACHSDQALALLAAPSEQERALLQAIPYQPNEAILHTDTRLLPRRRKAWASWNYRLPASEHPQATLTYNMNILQRLDAPTTFCVTLNDHEQTVDPRQILHRVDYDHPLFGADGLAAQKRLATINGSQRTWYCGAYWGYGFHEDGVQSALTTVGAFESYLENEELYLRRAG